MTSVRSKKVNKKVFTGLSGELLTLCLAFFEMSLNSYSLNVSLFRLNKTNFLRTKYMKVTPYDRNCCRFDCAHFILFYNAIVAEG